MTAVHPGDRIRFHAKHPDGLREQVGTVTTVISKTTIGVRPDGQGWPVLIAFSDIIEIVSRQPSS